MSVFSVVLVLFVPVVLIVPAPLGAAAQHLGAQRAERSCQIPNPRLPVQPRMTVSTARSVMRREAGTKLRIYPPRRDKPHLPPQDNGKRSSPCTLPNRRRLLSVRNPGNAYKRKPACSFCRTCALV